MRRCSGSRQEVAPPPRSAAPSPRSTSMAPTLSRGIDAPEKPPSDDGRAHVRRPLHRPQHDASLGEVQAPRTETETRRKAPPRRARRGRPRPNPTPIVPSRMAEATRRFAASATKAAITARTAAAAATRRSPTVVRHAGASRGRAPERRALRTAAVTRAAAATRAAACAASCDRRETMPTSPSSTMGSSASASSL